MVAALLNHSLLHRLEPLGADPRFAMLETVREYGREHLSASGDEAVIHDAHAAYFLAWAERAEPELHGADWLEIWPLPYRG